MARLFDALEGRPLAPLAGTRTVVPGAAEGPLLGGNLMVLSSLVGTGALPSLSGAVLLLEDVGERPYRLDRLWTQCLQAGVFRGVRGLVLGDFTDCEERGAAFTSAEVLDELAAALGVPCAAGFPVGHGPVNQPVPLGARVRLDAGARRLDFLEGPLRMMHGLAEVLQEGVQQGAFPLCRAEVVYQGRQVFSGGNAPAHTAFDLASLTKVMATTALVLDAGLDLGQPVRRWLPAAAVEATLDDLLHHRSGLPAFEPFFAAPLLAHPELASGEALAALRARTREQVLAAVLATAPLAPPGRQAVYSDLGFILLGAVLEAALGVPLDEAFRRQVARPLGLDGAGFRRLSHRPPLPTSLADTGATRPREPAPGQEGRWAVPAQPGGRGEVDDDNAFCLDGVSGHAGLFGTAQDVARFGQAVLSGGACRPPGPWGRDGTPGSTRARGFDTPGEQAPSCGPRFGRAGRRGAIGHTGFTGTSLWLDLDRGLVVALLTNRVAYGRANQALVRFRPRFHEAVLDALGLG